jgi:hypothetical protein
MNGGPTRLSTSDDIRRLHPTSGKGPYHRACLPIRSLKPSAFSEFFRRLQLFVRNKFTSNLEISSAFSDSGQSGMIKPKADIIYKLPCFRNPNAHLPQNMLILGEVTVLDMHSQTDGSFKVKTGMHTQNRHLT